MDDDEAVFSFAGFSRVAKLEIGDWESLAPILASEENVRTWETVSTSNDDCPIFPPNLHEGLYIHPNLDRSSASAQRQIKAAAIAPCSPDGHKEDEDSGPVSKSPSLSALRMIVSWFGVVRSRVSGRCGGSAEAVGVGVCSFAALAGMAGLLLYLRRVHRREKEFLLFLIEEKNQVWFLCSYLGIVVCLHYYITVLLWFRIWLWCEIVMLWLRNKTL